MQPLDRGENKMIDLIYFGIIITCVLLIIYHHLGYPLVLKWAQHAHPTDDIIVNPRQYANDMSDDQLPTIALIIPAYNEQQWIADKLRNCAALDYPSDKLNVIVACDGCTDNTVSLAQQAAQETACLGLNLEIRDFKNNRGKVAVLNDVIHSVDSELVALSDVSALISLDALLVAAAQFTNKRLGVLNSHYCLLEPGSVGEASYWQYQSKIKLAESSFGSTLGAHGAFYLFRRRLFQPLADDTINDDFILPMQIVANGYIAKQDNRIVSLELEQADNAMDWQRRVRIAAGNMQQVLRLKRMLHPHYKGIAFTFASGKALRVAMPFLMLTALIGSVSLAPSSAVFLLLAAVQISLYLLAFIQLALKANNKLLNILVYLVSGHMAGFVGALSYLFNDNKTPWKSVDSANKLRENNDEN
jgi:cellulose synthase/poly-beta-1,6-N-acetylglucosamine synthase-like glycosyltransferase